MKRSLRLVKKVNELRQTIQNELDERQQMLVKEKLNKQLAEETIDVSLPGRHIEIGSKASINTYNRRN